MRLCLKEWDALKEVCLRENISCNKLVEMIENTKNAQLGLTYATRLFTLLYFQNLSNAYLPTPKMQKVNSQTSANVLEILEKIK